MNGEPFANIGDTSWIRIPTLRSILQFLFIVVIWYGSDGASASYMFYPEALERFGSMNFNEVLLIVVAVGCIILFLLRRDVSFPASRLHIPVLIFFATLFVPWLRMSYNEGTFRIPYEMHRALGFFIAYLVSFVLFKPSESKKLYIFVLIIGVAKGVEACISYFLQPSAESTWAALAEWRDGLVLGMLLISWLAIFCFRNEISKRNYMIVTLGFIITSAGFIVSIRRSFIYALPLAGLSLLYGLDKKHKRRLLQAFALMIIVAAGCIFLINPTRFLTRLAVVGNPLEEWSAAYRIYEYKNVLLTIADSPWFGYPMGVPWKIHTLFPLGGILSPLAAHDMYLNILLRNGAVGFVILIYFVIATWRSILYCIRNAGTGFEKICASSLAGWWTMFLVSAFTAPLLTVTRSAVVGGVIIAQLGLLEGLLIQSQMRNQLSSELSATLQ